MRKPVEKVTVYARRCWICLKSWPTGTRYFAPIGDPRFACPGGKHRLAVESR